MVMPLSWSDSLQLQTHFNFSLLSMWTHAGASAARPQGGNAELGSVQARESWRHAGRAVTRCHRATSLPPAQPSALTLQLERLPASRKSHISIACWLLFSFCNFLITESKISARFEVLLQFPTGAHLGVGLPAACARSPGHQPCSLAT